MKGLIIWAHSNCRSLMGVYATLVKELKCPVVIALWKYPVDGVEGSRERVGFSSSEFSHLEMIPVGENRSAGRKILDEHPGYAHLFGVYQKSPNYRWLICEARRRGAKVGVLSEAPCVMQTGWRRVLKRFIYLPWIVPLKILKVVKSADFVINLSGEDSRPLEKIGWPKRKIIPFGYFPPPIPGSHLVRRVTNRDFHLLITGIMTWHRGPDVVIEALSILKRRGVSVRATFTQKGPLLDVMKKQAEKNSLEVEFPGFLPMKELIRLYETCSAFVAAGRAEPWGMRLNDALHAGAPLLVSRGMGGVNLVDRFDCGLAFANGDAEDLANQIQTLVDDDKLYERLVLNVETASRSVLPETQARLLIAKINRISPGWFTI